MKKIVIYFGTAILMIVFLVGAYWLAKHASYWLWYEDMVKETIREMVKPAALRGG